MQPGFSIDFATELSPLTAEVEPSPFALAEATLPFVLPSSPADFRETLWGLLLDAPQTGFWNRAPLQRSLHWP